MKITKEIKLENPKRCDGCPMLIFRNIYDEIYFDITCYYEHFTHKRQTNKNIERPQSCIKENGE